MAADEEINEFYIQNSEGLFFRGWIGPFPVWADERSDAHAYDSPNDMATDEFLLEKAHIPHRSVPA